MTSQRRPNDHVTTLCACEVRPNDDENCIGFDKHYNQFIRGGVPLGFHISIFSNFRNQGSLATMC